MDHAIAIELRRPFRNKHFNKFRHKDELQNFGAASQHPGCIYLYHTERVFKHKKGVTASHIQYILCI